MSALTWCTVIAVAGLALAGLGLLVANAWYDERDGGGWDE